MAINAATRSRLPAIQIDVVMPERKLFRDASYRKCEARHRMISVAALWKNHDDFGGAL